MRAASALVSGLLFGLGLCLSGMGDPAKVLAFLDITGDFDPSLAFVMAGAIAVALPGFRLLRRRAHPLYEARFHWPARTGVDRWLVLGSMTFGVGWGLSGFCPGPAIVSLPLAAPGTVAFCAAMMLGLTLGRLIRSYGATAAVGQAAE